MDAALAALENHPLVRKAVAIEEERKIFEVKLPFCKYDSEHGWRAQLTHIGFGASFGGSSADFSLGDVSTGLHLNVGASAGFKLIVDASKRASTWREVRRTDPPNAHARSRLRCLCLNAAAVSCSR